MESGSQHSQSGCSTCVISTILNITNRLKKSKGKISVPEGRGRQSVNLFARAKMKHSFIYLPNVLDHLPWKASMLHIRKTQVKKIHSLPSKNSQTHWGDTQVNRHCFIFRKEEGYYFLKDNVLSFLSFPFLHFFTSLPFFLQPSLLSFPLLFLLSSLAFSFLSTCLK